jgi:hypothetical protein
MGYIQWMDHVRPCAVILRGKVGKVEKCRKTKIVGKVEKCRKVPSTDVTVLMLLLPRWRRLGRGDSIVARSAIEAARSRDRLPKR